MECRSPCVDQRSPFEKIKGAMGCRSPCESTQPLQKIKRATMIANEKDPLKRSFSNHMCRLSNETVTRVSL